MRVLPLQRELFGLRGGAETAARTEMHRLPPGEAWRRALRRRWRVLVLMIGAALASAALVAFCRQPRYLAMMRVVVQRPAPWLQFPPPAPASPPGPTAVQTAAQELGSRATVAAALAAMGPRAQGLFAPPLRRPRWLARRWPRAADATAQVERLRRRLSIITSSNSRVLEIRFTAPRPGSAAAFLRHLSAAFLARSAARQRAAAATRVAFLQTQAQTARARAQAAAQALAAVAAAEGLSDPAAQLQIAGQRWRQLAAAETSAELSALQQADALARHAPAASADGGAVPPALLLERAQLDARVHSLATEYQAQAPPLRQAREQLAAVDASLRTLRSQQIEQQQHALAAVRQQTQDLRAALAGQSRNQMKLTAALARFDLAQQQVSAQRHTYSAVLEQLQQALAVAGAAAPPLRVADPATAAPRPVAPALRSALLAALLLGGALGLAAAWTLDRWDDRLGWPEANELGVPVAAVLPTPPKSASGWAAVHCAAIPAPEFARAVDLCAASLLAARPLGGPRVLLIASTGAAEGKTTLALHLAACWARLGQPVLLLDAHAAAPALHQAFAGTLSPGMSEILDGRATVETALRPCGMSPYMRYIAAGAAPLSSPCLLLAGGGAADLLTAARSRFDWVLLDGPPVSAGPEAGLWAELADATLVAARHAHTSRRQLRRALDALEVAGAPDVALAITGAPLSAYVPVGLWRPQGAAIRATAQLRHRA